MLKLKFNQIHRISRAPQYSKLTSNLNFSENFIYVLEKQNFSGGRKGILNLVPKKKKKNFHEVPWVGNASQRKTIQRNLDTELVSYIF